MRKKQEGKATTKGKKQISEERKDKGRELKRKHINCKTNIRERHNNEKQILMIFNDYLLPMFKLYLKF